MIGLVAERGGWGGAYKRFLCPHLSSPPDDTGKRWQFANQEESPHRKLILLDLDLGLLVSRLRK